MIQHQDNEYEMSRRVYHLLCVMASPDEIQLENEVAKQIAQAKEFLKNNLTKKIAVDDVAEIMHLSPAYFSKIFKANCGFSPYDYLLRLRLEKAKELLVNTRIPIGEIAYQTGFNSEANFIYFFKKQTGLSPLKFRKLQF